MRRKRRRNLECRGEVRTLAEWEKITGLKKSTIQSRLKNGWTVEEALFTAQLPHGLTRKYTPESRGCRGCYYYRLLQYSTSSTYHTRYCAYILITGHKRPCPAAHCTEYMPARQGQKGMK